MQIELTKSPRDSLQYIIIIELMDYCTLFYKKVFIMTKYSRFYIGIGTIQRNDDV